jgi:hypothetical protein
MMRATRPQYVGGAGGTLAAAALALAAAVGRACWQVVRKRERKRPCPTARWIDNNVF